MYSIGELFDILSNMFRLLPAFVLLLSSYAHAGPIYVYREKDGVIHFTSKPPPAGVNAEVFTGKDSNVSIIRGSFGGGRTKLFRDEFGEHIQAAARDAGISMSLIKAVIHAESAFNPRAISPKGAQGLMQLMPDVSRLLGVKNPFDPKQNINGGSAYLAFLLRKYDGNERLALAAYNAGQGAVEEYNGIPPYSETRTYVRKVLELKQRYEKKT